MIFDIQYLIFKFQSSDIKRKNNMEIRKTTKTSICVNNDKFAIRTHEQNIQVLRKETPLFQLLLIYSYLLRLLIFKHLPSAGVSGSITQVTPQ